MAKKRCNAIKVDLNNLKMKHSLYNTIHGRMHLMVCTFQQHFMN